MGTGNLKMETLEIASLFAAGIMVIPTLVIDSVTVTATATATVMDEAPSAVVAMSIRTAMGGAP